MPATKQARVKKSTRGRKPDHHFLFDPLLSYETKVKWCLALTEDQMQKIAAQHGQYAVALKLQLGLSPACCASMQELIPHSEHHIKGLHQEAAKYVQDTTEQPPQLPIDPHVMYVDAQTASGVIVQASGDKNLQLDNTLFKAGEFNYEEERFGSKRSEEMEKPMCKIAVYWGVLGFNVRVVKLDTREGVEEMRPKLPRPSIQAEGTQEMANIFGRALDRNFFRSNFEIPKENTTPSSNLTNLRAKLEQKLGVQLPASASAQRPYDGATSAQEDQEEHASDLNFMDMPEQDSWISHEERYGDMQQSKDSGGKAASGACCTPLKTEEEEEREREESIIKFIMEGEEAMEDENNSWYNECVGDSADKDDNGSFGGECSVQAGASSAGYGILDGASLEVPLTSPPVLGTPDAEAQTPKGGSAEQSWLPPPVLGTPDAEAQTPKGGSAVEVPTASAAKRTTKGTRLRKKKKKGLHAQGANPGVPTEVECKDEAARATKRRREERMLPALSPAKQKTAASVNTHAVASDDSMHAVEPLLNSDAGAKAPSKTTMKKGRLTELMVVGGFL
jgi:hypothetical protein